MSEYRRQSAFLKNLLAYDDSPSTLALQERLVTAERNERCIFSACRLVASIGILSLFGFGYTAVLLPQFFDHSSHVLIKLFSALELGSVMCFVVFVGLWLWYRAAAHKVREECRQAIGRLLEARLRPELDRSAPVIRHAPYLSVLRPTGTLPAAPAAPAPSSSKPLRKAS
jgi:hypothetical protein